MLLQNDQAIGVLQDSSAADLTWTRARVFIMPSQGNDTSACLAVAKNIQHGSLEFTPYCRSQLFSEKAPEKLPLDSRHLGMDLRSNWI